GARAAALPRARRERFRAPVAAGGCRSGTRAAAPPRVPGVVPGVRAPTRPAREPVPEGRRARPTAGAEAVGLPPVPEPGVPPPPVEAPGSRRAVPRSVQEPRPLRAVAEP